MRQIVLDTETTGLDTAQGHRVIEIGCVELENRRLTGKRFHCYLNPERDIDEGAVEVHGITSEFLADKPQFRQIAADFLAFIGNAELIIHNAPFDIGFLNAELGRLDGQIKMIEDYAQIIDTLVMARRKHPGQRNKLDALCKRYAVDNSHRDLHGALLDAEILAEVYLAMTGGQTHLSLGVDDSSSEEREIHTRKIDREKLLLKVIRATDAELTAHETCLQAIEKISGKRAVWVK
jgi:DNA polymerase III subunit epsilon